MPGIIQSSKARRGPSGLSRLSKALRPSSTETTSYPPRCRILSIKRLETASSSATRIFTGWSPGRVRQGLHNPGYFSLQISEHDCRRARLPEAPRRSRLAAISLAWEAARLESAPLRAWLACLSPSASFCWIASRIVSIWRG